MEKVSHPTPSGKPLVISVSRYICSGYHFLKDRKSPPLHPPLIPFQEGIFMIPLLRGVRGV